MLDHPFRFYPSSIDYPLDRPYLIRILRYTFRIEDKIRSIYLVEIEVYPDNLHVIKFYPKRFKGHKHRFNLLTGDNLASRIIATCVYIIGDILSKNPSANFGFLGSRSMSSNYELIEHRSRTKRFRIYQQACVDYFGPDSFSHYPDPLNSSYLIINNKNEDIKGIVKRSKRMFEEIFPLLNED